VSRSRSDGDKKNSEEVRYRFETCKKAANPGLERLRGSKSLVRSGLDGIWLAVTPMASVASWAKPLNDQHMGLGDVLAHRCEAGNELFVDVVGA
jgi:hypothetical protein